MNRRDKTQDLETKLRRLSEELDKRGTAVPGIMRRYLAKALKKGSRETRLALIEYLGEECNLLPYVIYRQSDGNVEDLGKPGFLAGDAVENYLGLVLSIHRFVWRRDVGEIYHHDPDAHRTENAKARRKKGTSPSVETLEGVLERLGLRAEYLVEPANPRKANPVPARKHLRERLEEIDEKWPELSNPRVVGAGRPFLVSGIRNFIEGKDVSMVSLKVIADYYKKIPVAMFRKSDGCVEDLGHPFFLQGEPIPNYVGKVLSKHRIITGLTTRDLGRLSGINATDVVGYTCGRSMKLNLLEKLCETVGLVPVYLADTVPNQQVEDLLKLYFHDSSPVRQDRGIVLRYPSDGRTVMRAVFEEYAKLVSDLPGPLKHRTHEFVKKLAELFGNPLMEDYDWKVDSDSGGKTSWRERVIELFDAYQAELGTSAKSGLGPWWFAKTSDVSEPPWLTGSPEYYEGFLGKELEVTLTSSAVPSSGQDQDGLLNSGVVRSVRDVFTEKHPKAYLLGISPSAKKYRGRCRGYIANRDYSEVRLIFGPENRPLPRELVEAVVKWQDPSFELDTVRLSGE